MDCLHTRTRTRVACGLWQAEELGDGDAYEDDARLSSLQPGGRGGVMARNGRADDHNGSGGVGSLLGEEFTSPHVGSKGD